MGDMSPPCPFTCVLSLLSRLLEHGVGVRQNELPGHSKPAPPQPPVAHTAVGRVHLFVTLHMGPAVSFLAL